MSDAARDSGIREVQHGAVRPQAARADERFRPVRSTTSIGFRPRVHRERSLFPRWLK